MCLVVSPLTGKVAGLRVVGKVVLTLVLVLVGNFFLRLVVAVEVRRQEEVEELGPVPPGPVLSQTDQAVSALQALVGLLDPAVGAQVRGLVEGLLPPKPVSPAPATPTHAQIVAKLHKLYDSETQLIRKVDEVEGRVQKS